MKKVTFSAILALLFCSSCIFAPNPSVLTDGQKILLTQAVELSNEGQFAASYDIINKLLQEKVYAASVEFYTGFLIEKLKNGSKTSIRHYKNAISLMKATGEKDPILQSMIWFYMSYSYERMKNADRAEYALNAAFAILDKLNSVGRLDNGIGFYMLAYCYDKHNQKELSVEFYLKAIKYFEDRQLNYYYLRGALYNIGLYHYNSNDFKEAVRYWKMAFDKEPLDGYFKAEYEKWYTIAKEQANTGSAGLK